MPKEYSPFTPGQPVPIEFFVGRVQEIERLKSALMESQDGRLRVAFLTGERGIGKSSLAAFVRYLGERDYQVLGIHTFLGGVTSLEEMVRRIFDRLLKESIDKSWQKKIERFFGNHIREIGLFGISLEFEVREEDLKRMVHDFVPSIRRLVEEVRDEKKSLFIILDDINGLATSKEFAEWLKSLVDEIATAQRPMPLFLLLVGLEERRQSLIKSQPSLARVFDLVEIRAWSPDETGEFFKTAFSKVGMVIEPAALEILVQYCGGLPVLAHEIGDATFRADTDGKIDRKDALNGVVAAADIVGRKHLEPQVFQAIRSQRYRAILRTLAAPPFDRKFKRSKLREHLTSDQAKVLDNFLGRMKQLGVIRPDPEEGPGAYSFGNLLHYLYMKIEAARARETHER
jgi:hypothetical protein